MSTAIRKILIFCLLGVVLLIVYGVLHYSIKQLISSESDHELLALADDFYKQANSSNSYKFILQWTPSEFEPFFYMGVGRNGFVRRNCAFTNCVVTSRRNLLKDIRDYNVIVFDGSVVVSAPVLNKDFPVNRSPSQKYVFASMESADNYPICSNRLDGIFNWTWTYKLDSDARWGYILIKDSNNVVIGPNKIMHWIKLQDMNPVAKDFKEKMRSKTKAVAWFVSNCRDKAGRFVFAKELKKELNKYDLDLDIYGRCGTLTCDDRKKCDEMIANEYYFYLAFENSLSEDYVTEKLLRALKNNAVPVVFGGANYSRFMPDGIYLNAIELGPEALAATMHKYIKDPDQYINLFKWKNHYSYHSREESAENNDYCDFCAMINDEDRMTKETSIERFKDWWDPFKTC